MTVSIINDGSYSIQHLSDFRFYIYSYIPYLIV